MELTAQFFQGLQQETANLSNAAKTVESLQNSQIVQYVKDFVGKVAQIAQNKDSVRSVLNLMAQAHTQKNGGNLQQNKQNLVTNYKNYLINNTAKALSSLRVGLNSLANLFYDLENSVGSATSNLVEIREAVKAEDINAPEAVPDKTSDDKASIPEIKKALSYYKSKISSNQQLSGEETRDLQRIQRIIREGYLDPKTYDKVSGRFDKINKHLRSNHKIGRIMKPELLPFEILKPIGILEQSIKDSIEISFKKAKGIPTNDDLGLINKGILKAILNDNRLKPLIDSAKRAVSTWQNDVKNNELFRLYQDAEQLNRLAKERGLKSLNNNVSNFKLTFTLNYN